MLKPALEHLQFALSLCREQHAAGRFFLLEHPSTATSWQTQMVQDVLKLDGVRRIVFDFCMLGMTSPTENGPSPVLKPTGILTNSNCIASLLQEFRCHGQHEHIQLTGGRARACEQYPDKFCDVVMQGLQRELENNKMDPEDIQPDGSHWNH